MILEGVVAYLNGTYVTSFKSNFGLTYDENDLFAEDSMMGDVQRGKADVAGEFQLFQIFKVVLRLFTGVSGWPDRHRLHFLRFFGPTTPDTIRFVYRAPPISLVRNMYLLSFDLLSWYCIGGILLVGMVLLFTVLRQERRFSRFNKSNFFKPK